MNDTDYCGGGPIRLGRSRLLAAQLQAQYRHIDEWLPG